jgi:lon-related putative ATP-dependent protease
MCSNLELKVESLKLIMDNLPEFTSTEEFEPFDGVIGQKRATQSLELGLNMDSKEYNIYISGKTGTGKTGYIVRKIEEYANTMDAPDDWCYVYNFDKPSNPLAISLKAGTAMKFKGDLANFIKFVAKEVPIFFNSKNYDDEKHSITDKYDRIMMEMTKNLSSKARELDFDVRQASTGEFVFIPLKEEKEMTEEDFENLSDEERNNLEDAVTTLRNYSVDVIKQTRNLNKKIDEELKELDERIAETIISSPMEELLDKYGINEAVINFLKALKKDLIENISNFVENEEKSDKAELINLFFRRYEVNVIVSNSANKGAPVVFADSCQVGQLFGNIQYENKLGNMLTDFTLISPGYLHKANGGFLIIKAHELLSNPHSWEILKRSINLKTISIDNFKFALDLMPISTINPEEIPLKVKVILLGSNLMYSLLLERDMDFEKLFKIKAEFDSEIEASSDNIDSLIGFLSHYVRKNNLPHISREGISKLLKYSSKLVEKRNKFSASMSKVLKIVDLAAYFAKVDKASLIEGKHVDKALEENEAMHGLVRQKVLDMYNDKKYVVDLKGNSVGQINGLSVDHYGDCTIGQQHKITVSTYAGREGIINIEREAEMSGSIHDKGIMILSGFLGQLVGQQIPISFNASIVFEQLYSGIEGDSASAAELIALLSSLSDVPLKQSLAITGSVNQRGDIQPIGGVNHKVEGFFDICSIFGLDGSHGVIIPSANLDELILKDKVIEAVEKGLFHIYAVNSIKECLEILCVNSSEKDAQEDILDNIKQKIISKLKSYNDVLKASYL